MFEDTIKKWNEYVSRRSRDWGTEDPRHDLSVEVRSRLRQLDLIIEFELAASDRAAVDPLTRTLSEYHSSFGPALASGEMSEADYRSGLESRLGLPEYRAPDWRAFDEVELFTEAFYLFAYRIGLILGGSKEPPFPSMDGFEPSGVATVRNRLIQHRRSFSGGAFALTSKGPMLKTTNPRPPGGHPDPGLWVNVEQFHEELNGRLDQDAQDG